MVVFHDRDQRASHRDVGTVQGVRQLRLVGLRIAPVKGKWTDTLSEQVSGIPPETHPACSNNIDQKRYALLVSANVGAAIDGTT